MFIPASTYRHVHALLSLIDTNLSLWTDIERTYRQQRYGPVEDEDDDAETVSGVLRRAVDRPIRYKDVIMPEVSVVAAWLCLMKMTYGFDGEVRHVRGVRIS